ncbi:hypothetical protein C3F09_09290 [candidate division GN15 bacterium]|uniref:Flagellar hook-length control protein-like C-terminal domain-containing protein n=1 Tax=candidate division GN15 bacterium TaxID=2072418 RepID=A0A855WXX7_9BACT|nr:MAG: hypothetical protein C3F09_09290 [candidate division GN15 bacterium]
MSLTTGNAVMDLLLGKVAPSQSGNAAPQGVGQTSDGSGFADLLSLLSGISNNNVGITGGDDTGSPAGDLLSSDDTAQNTPNGNQITIDPAQANQLAVLAGLIPTIEATTIPALRTPTAADNNVLSISAEAVPDQSLQKAIDSMLLPKEAVLPNPQVLALLNQVPVTLPTGKFAVLSSKVSDGTLQMEVASQETPNQTIKLSIPTALLHTSDTPQSNPAIAAAGIAGKPNAGLKVPLADPWASTERFDQLLAKVNVKEIEITPSQIAASTKETPAQVAIALVAENAGMPVAVTGRMNKNQIMASTQRRAQVIETLTGQEKTDSDLADSGNATEKNTPAKTAVAATKDMTIESFSTVIDKQSGIGVKMTGTEPSIEMSKGTRQQRAVATAPVERPAVRMTIQQEMPTLSHLEGRTLMIKLEPEYLGTARLHLTMRQDTLSARVMVETPQAKQAVESSLSQLTDQLTKAGIKVDYIDVGVRGGGAQNQFFNRQSNWFRAQNPRIALARDNELISRDLTAATVARPMANYLAADRVNIYA